jgi:thiosulfate dehydrogenase (quinone) large subunit
MDSRQALPLNKDAALGYLFLRTTLGLNIFMHGLTRLLAGPAAFAETLVQLFHGTPLPSGMVGAFAYALPWLEAVIGLLLLLGAATRLALCAGALLIFVLTFGTALRQDWQVAALQLFYAAVYAALLAFRGHNAFSVDSVWMQKQQN